MTTIFEESENTPLSPSSDLLDASLKASDLGDSKLPTRVTASAANSAAAISEPNRQVGSHSDVAANDGTFTSFTVNDASQLPPGVRVVHVQTVDPSHPPVQSGTVPSGTSVGSPVNVTYTVNSSGQIHLQSSEAIAAVLDGSAQQDGQRYTYYQGVAASDSATSAGQFYVMMSPQEVIPVATSSTPRIIAPRTQTLTSLGDGTFTVEGTDETLSVEFRKVETSRSSRDERRRATHNEVERRRRDKINTWIMKLAAVVPDCQGDQSKQGTSKGGVLSKALDYIVKLRGQNERMADTIKEQERILVENQVLRQQVEKLRQENAILQANLQLHHTESMDEQKGGME